MVALSILGNFFPRYKLIFATFRKKLHMILWTNPKYREAHLFGNTNSVKKCSRCVKSNHNCTPSHFSWAPCPFPCDYAKYLNARESSLPPSSAITSGISRLQDSSCKFNGHYLGQAALKTLYLKKKKIKLNRQCMPCLCTMKYATNIFFKRKDDLNSMDSSNSYPRCYRNYLP